MPFNANYEITRVLQDIYALNKLDGVEYVKWRARRDFREKWGNHMDLLSLLKFIPYFRRKLEFWNQLQESASIHAEIAYQNRKANEQATE